MVETHGRTPRQSGVQELQSALAYVDIYPTVASQPSSSRRWQGQKGFGIRHVNDDIPFSLWDEHTERFRHASRPEMHYIVERYDARSVSFYEWMLVVETLSPPKPTPLTVAGVPARFVPSKEESHVCPYGVGAIPSRSVPDPCPHVNWGRRQSPTKEQMCAVIDAVSGFAPVRRVNFMYAATMVELEVGYGNGDGRKYLREFLPGIVANRPTSYHRDAVSFLSGVRNHARERTLDPARLFPGPLPQDVTDYINEPNWGILSPGMRVSPGCAADTGARTETVSSTTSGIMLRRGEDCYVTVANHGFSDVQDIFHPAPSGEKIGDVVDRYPELDIAMVRLTPSNSDRYTNRMYFQAATPKRLADVIDMVPGRWFEVDGMSTGLLSLMYCGRSMEKPTRSPGPENPPIPTDQWQQKNLFNIFGGTNPQLLEGICGAPLVEEDTGLVAGFFHLAVGDWAECAVLDDLVAEGWQIV